MTIPNKLWNITIVVNKIFISPHFIIFNSYSRRHTEPLNTSHFPLETAKEYHNAFTRYKTITIYFVCKNVFATSVHYYNETPLSLWPRLLTNRFEFKHFNNGQCVHSLDTSAGLFAAGSVRPYFSLPIFF
jgi:hypothetical protein